MKVGCYTLDLYCDGNLCDDCSARGHRMEPATFCDHQTYGNCKRDAQARGWRFCRDGKVHCPACSGKKDRTLPEKGMTPIEVIETTETKAKEE